jgi:hypothetical protein
MKSTLPVALFTGTIALMSWTFVSPTLVLAQAVGDDAVYNSTNGIAFSPSFIDASTFLPPNSTLGNNPGTDGTFPGFFGKWGNVPSVPAFVCRTLAPATPEIRLGRSA